MVQSVQNLASAPSSASVNKLSAPSSVFGRLEDALSLICLTGRLLHNETKINPLHHMQVRLYEDKRLRFDSEISSTFTNFDGKFNFIVQKDFLQKPLYIIVNGKNPRAVRVNLPIGESELNDIKVEYYEYDSSFPKERKPPLDLGVLSDPLDLPYSLALGKGVGPWLALAESLKVCEDQLAIEDVQKAFSLFKKNLTVLTEESPDTKGKIFTGAWFGSRLFVGFNPGHLLKGERSDTFLLEYNWDRYELDNNVHQNSAGEDQPYSLSNVRCHFRKVGLNLEAYKVELQHRILPEDKERARRLREKKVSPPVFNKKTKTLDLSRLSNWRTITEETPDLFEKGLKIARISYSVAGEADQHLCYGHMKVGELFQALRNLQLSPVQKIIGPFLSGVDKINNLGSEVIFGPKGVLATATGLTSKGLAQRFKRVLGHMDYLNFSPRKPISAADIYARAANLYWKIINDWVARQICENKTEIERYWPEIKKMSDDLVAHSVPRHRLDGKRREEWADCSEVDPKRPSPTIIRREKIKRKAMSPITTNDFPVDVDWMNLLQYCSYAIFFSTFWHSWVHDRQTDGLGDVNYATIGMKEGGNPQARDLIDQLKLAYALPSVQFGYIIENEYQDIDPILIQMLLRHKEEFEALGFNPLKIRSRVNI